MPIQIKTITLPLPFKMGSVNCYLIRDGSGFVLIDTGGSNKQAVLEAELLKAGCRPGELRLILLTHGDFDHAGNGAFLRRMFGAKIGMHRGDLDMVERGDMFAGRNRPNALIRLLLPVMTGFGKSKRFTPDFFVTAGDDLTAHGFEARVLSIPGHSQGSVGFLLPSGDLICGDLLENVKGPGLNSLMDDGKAARASIEQLRRLEIGTVYPGHGRPFPMAALPDLDSPA